MKTNDRFNHHNATYSRVNLVNSALVILSSQAERRLQAGDLTAEQHHDLVDKLQQLYALQRNPEPVRLPPQEARALPHPQHQPRHKMSSRMEEPPFRPGERSNVHVQYWYMYINLPKVQC